ncbi:hypothetical protein SAC12B_0048 [Lactobacillus phage SAC12B]|uniref:Uncharacterized protein n=1 Tax=Lactobacillus phage SAC12B TaxID=2510941 RepID=A0A4Y5FH16_9CAUD|nr:hypothetical protein HWC10_gp048 [Lactobacillus phage SAC12B]QBJ03837.1 hypothetical protein SAC12B_0048 [Lactobacillus phage SAC12B]
MSIHVGNIDDKSVNDFINALDIRKDEPNMYKDIENKLDKLVAKDIVSEWRWESDKLLVFVNDSDWEEFKEITDRLFVLDDNGLKAYIQDDYICLELDPDEDFNA